MDGLSQTPPTVQALLVKCEIVIRFHLSYLMLVVVSGVSFETRVLMQRNRPDCIGVAGFFYHPACVWLTVFIGASLTVTGWADDGGFAVIFRRLG
ncbi:MAG: hypothetical protein ACR2OA_15835 [Rubripirellula sp.]